MYQFTQYHPAHLVKNTATDAITSINDIDFIDWLKAGGEPLPLQQTHIDKRVAEYPPVVEQLDMQLKGTWEASILAIKARYPKGELFTTPIPDDVLAALAELKSPSPPPLLPGFANQKDAQP